MSPFVLILATGTETDTQIALRFAPHYPIAFLCDAQHNPDQPVKAVQDADGEVEVFKADLSSTELSTPISTITRRFGNRCAAAIFQLRNDPIVASGFLEQTAVDFRQNAISPIKNAYAFSRQTLPLLLNHADGSGYPPTLIFSGASGNSYSDEINEGALVALSRSLGREVGKKGIHVCHVKYKASNRPNPESAAETYWHLHTQPLSCFSNEITI
ncbi:hypothetical protein ASPVEDRAFT_151896 [Aspergillus versicolor CBS 583.65]|uniref:Ketoreductase (KR) domain-containing protein n=1 Tax=Aspergillus versicolor CBS 583.65 TaxID=1036611 RepID=A0A1L9PPB2_ASPVE|nr:uncharacterized protein ASPVEDRAFT_151896 [Aspergillus versicolor CBS 583.65]OJJ03369.1 hypothetical protein ASPVEDRAFT_151896 [Aspergillus versicolor CBS 583.65]